jgi:hypothetical protein
VRILAYRLFELDCKEEFSVNMKKEKSYENKTLRHAQSFDKQIKGMQLKIEVGSDFEDTTENYPKQLLKAVRQSLNYQENRYQISNALTALQINLRQR